MCQNKIPCKMFTKTRHRNAHLLCSELGLKRSIKLFSVCSFLLIHSVSSIEMHDDNIAQESLDTSVRVKAPRAFSDLIDQTSYLEGKDLMADESVDIAR